MEEIACALNDFGSRWCKREVGALKAWKRSIFTIVNKRIKFYSQNTYLLALKPKSSFRHLKQGIQEFHRKYVLVPADKAANNVVVVSRLQQLAAGGDRTRDLKHRDFMDSLNHDNQADVIESFNSTSRYLDDLLNIDNPYFEGMVNQIYPPELQLNKANISDTEAPFLDLHLSVENGFVSSKIYDKRDDFDFDIVNFPFLDGEVPCRASYGVYISQLIRFARVCNHVTDFNARNKCLTAKLLQQDYRYHKLRKTFSKFYRRHYELISKYNVGLQTL